MRLLLKIIWEWIQIAGLWMYGLYLKADNRRLIWKLKRLDPVWWAERQSKIVNRK